MPQKKKIQVPVVVGIAPGGLASSPLGETAQQFEPARGAGRPVLVEQAEAILENILAGRDQIQVPVPVKIAPGHRAAPQALQGDHAVQPHGAAGVVVQ